MVGQFLPSREFVVDLLVSNEDGEQISLTAVVDTGFSGYLTLPISVIRRLNLPQTDIEEASIADGSIIRFGVYEATVEWDEEERTVAALATEGDALIGISLMMKSIGTFEFDEGGSVFFEPTG